MARTKIAPALEHLVSLGSEVYAGMEWMPEARRELRSLLRVYRAAEELTDLVHALHRSGSQACATELRVAQAVEQHRMKMARSREGGKAGGGR